MRLRYPISANRYWRRSGHVTHVSSEAKAYKRHAALVAKLAGVLPVDVDVAVAFVLHPPMTKKGTASARRIDLDNAIKVSTDALIGVVYHDDKQVTLITAMLGEPLPDGGLSVAILDAAKAAALRGFLSSVFSMGQGPASPARQFEPAAPASPLF